MKNRVLQLLGGTVLGLLLAEGMFRIADRGAFPHLNVYDADAMLGTRLRPGATQRVAFGGNPVTSVRINAEGYRGADWGQPEAGEVVVLGDSQVFGLGVEEDQTASAVLASTLGRPVRNAGIPTHGPPEYLTVLDELLASRKPETVVLVLNFANDLLEVSTPNTRRHAVWDGWAVRLETAPETVMEFPGRRWLFSRSHLVHAVRRAWRTPPEAASEATWAGVLGIAHKAKEGGGRSPLAGAVAAAKARCDDAGAELLVVALPLDVQVSATEWARYGVEPRDMSGTRVLLEDLVVGAEHLGVRALDATEALAAAEPGAFLDADVHMTPKGQAALAAAIASKLAEPAPVASARAR